jgi:hypothetical protein
MRVSREDVLRYRVHVQELDRTGGSDAAILDIGVQDTGPDGAAWALRIRGCEGGDLFTAWTLRGAPHVYRLSEAAEVAAATTPMSSVDAAKRVISAATPLKAAGIDVMDALGAIATEMRDIVREPMVKGDMSTKLTARMSEPYKRFCQQCNAIHLYELPFRLSALQAGLELQPGTSPPVLQRIPGWNGPTRSAPQHLQPIRAYLHLLGPATPKQVASYIDAPVKEVVAHWPDDTVEVEVEGEPRELLAGDRDALAKPADVSGTIRLLGPFDPFMQGKDRELLIPDTDRHKDVWRTLGRPGSILNGHEIVGTWRPRSSGQKLRLVIDRWAGVPEEAVLEQAELLAEHRGVRFDGFMGAS